MPSLTDKPIDPLFNSGIGYVNELSLIRRGLHSARFYGNIKNRYDLLMSYYTALIPEMERQDKHDMIEGHETFYIKINDLYNQWEAAEKGKKKGFPKEIYEWFTRWEMQLRIDENKLGLMMPTSDDPSNAIGRSHF